MNPESSVVAIYDHIDQAEEAVHGGEFTMGTDSSRCPNPPVQRIWSQRIHGRGRGGYPAAPHALARGRSLPSMERARQNRDHEHRCPRRHTHQGVVENHRGHPLRNTGAKQPGFSSPATPQPSGWLCHCSNSRLTLARVPVENGQAVRREGKSIPLPSPWAAQWNTYSTLQPREPGGTDKSKDLMSRPVPRVPVCGPPA
jgi:hypothetical protein